MTTSEQLNKVQKAQNFAAKVTYGGVSKYDHVTPILRELRWLTIEHKVIYDICIFTYKVLHNMLPEWLFKFATVGELQQRPTRQSTELVVKRTSTDIAKKSIDRIGPKNFNCLPSDLKYSISLQSFKSKLKKHFLNQLYQ